MPTQPSDSIVFYDRSSVAQDGDVVVALIDDETTIKELHMTSEAVILKPVSSNRKHAPIILARDFRIQGVVVASFPDPARPKPRAAARSRVIREELARLPGAVRRSVELHDMAGLTFAETAAAEPAMTP